MSIMLAQRMLPTLSARGATCSRTYATSPAGGPPSAGGSNRSVLYGGLAALIGVGSYFTYQQYEDGNQKTAQRFAKVKAELDLEDASALNKDEFRTFKLVKVEPYNHNTSRFTFQLPKGTSSGLTVASALVVKSVTEGQGLDAKSGKPAIRPYTPVSKPTEKEKLELLIKHYKGGAMTEHIFGLKEGDSLAFKGPIPKFPYKANEFESVSLIAGGSGITPMWQIMQAIDNNPEDKTKVNLVFANVSEEDILLRKEFEDMAKRKPDQFKVNFVLDKPPSKGWKGHEGYINQKILAQVLPGPAYGDRIKIFVCGPPGQVNAISGTKVSMKDQGPLKGLLADLGYQESQVYKF